jgi:hypothetical protein
MAQPRLFLTALAMVLAFRAAAASAETLGDPRVGFSAERVLVLDGRRYVGRMWNMPGEQRHEQPLAALDPVFILHADTATGDIVLPNLHTAVSFGFPKVLAFLGKPGNLGKPEGTAAIEGIATTRYAIDKAIPEGHVAGDLWLSRDGIPMRCAGSFTDRKGRISTVRWELHHVRIGPQDAALFEVPPGYTTLPSEAASALLGLHLAPHSRH